MAKVWIVKYQGTTHYIPKEQCETSGKAAEIIGCKAGVNCTVKTAITPPDMTAEEWIAKQTVAQVTTTPSTTETGTRPAGFTTKPTAPTSTPAPTTTPSIGPSTGYPYATSPNPPPNPVDNWMRNPISPGVYYAGPGAGYPTADGSISGGGGGWTESQILDYNAYIAFQKDNSDWPVPKDIDDYFANIVQWAEGIASGAGEGVAEGGWTDDQKREYYNWLSYYSSYGELTDWKPVNIEDFYNNYEQAQTLMASFQQRQAQTESERAEAEAYTQEQREYQEYQRQEAFRETPMLGEHFTGWMEGQSGFSGALRQYIEREYPSLKSEFEAGMPRPVGYSTREEARTEAARRESQWRAWLPQQVPELTQEYYGQPPLQRGERPYMYQPTMRGINW